MAPSVSPTATMEEEDSFDTWQRSFSRVQYYRTPSASSGTVYPFQNAGSKALSAARDVSDLRRNMRSEPRGASDGDNLCYRNSVLLTLLCNDSFIGFIRNHWEERRRSGISQQGHIHESTPFELLSELWQDYWDSDVKQGQLNNKLKKVWRDLTTLPERGQIHGWNPPLHWPGEQEDAQDFLQWMIQYEKECASNLEGTFEDYMRLFTLPLTNWRMCVGCASKEGPKKRVRHQPDLELYSLLLKLPAGAKTPQPLHELVQDHLKYLVDGWFCEQCTTPKKGEAEFPLEVRNEMRKKNADDYEGPPAWKYAGPLPEVLFIHLDRGWKTETSKEDIKISTEVDVPARFTFESSWLDPDYYKGDRELVQREYKLTGVVAHKGKSVNSGHYKTNVLVDGQWYDINGERCTKSDFEHAKTNKHGFDPVILVWQKQNIETNDVRFKASPAAQQTAPRNSGSKKSRTSAQGSHGSNGQRRIIRQAKSGSLGSGRAQRDPVTPPAGSGAAGRKGSARPSTPGSVASSNMGASEFYLKLNVALDNQSYLLHHKITPPADILHNTYEDDGPQVKIDAHLLYEESSETTFQLDLFRAATRPDHGFKLIADDSSFHQWVPHRACDCKDVHEGECRNLKRKFSAIEAESSEAVTPEKRRKVLPALFERRGDDPYNYPSIEERYKIQQATDHALKCQQKWKSWKPPVIEHRALGPMTEAGSNLRPRQRETLGLSPSPRLLDNLSKSPSNNSSQKSGAPASVPAYQSPSPADGPARVKTPHTPPDRAIGCVQLSDGVRSKTPHSLASGEGPPTTSVARIESSPSGGRHASPSPAQRMAANLREASMITALENDMVSGQLPGLTVINGTPEAIPVDVADPNVPSPANFESKSPAKSDSGSGRGSSQRPTSPHASSPPLLDGTVIYQQIHRTPENETKSPATSGSGSGSSQRPAHTPSPPLFKGAATMQQYQDLSINNGGEGTVEINELPATQQPWPVPFDALASRIVDHDPSDSENGSSDIEGTVSQVREVRRPSPRHHRGSHSSSNATLRRRSSSASLRSHHTASVRTRQSSAAPVAAARSNAWANRIRQPFTNYRHGFLRRHRNALLSMRYVFRSLGWVKRQMRRYPKVTSTAVFICLILASGSKPTTLRLPKRVLAMLVRQIERLFGLAIRGGAQAVGLTKMAAKLGRRLARLVGGKAGKATEWVKELIERVARDVAIRGGRVKGAVMEAIEPLVNAIKTGLGDPEAWRRSQAGRDT